MGQRDRSTQDWNPQGEPRRRDSQSGERSGASGSARRYHPDDDEPLDIPPWSASGSRGSSKDSFDDFDAGPPPREPRPESRSSRSRGGRTESFPRLGDAFDRGSRRGEPEDDRSAPSTRDPYDRLRRVANKPQRPVDYGDEPRGFEVEGGDYPDLPPVPRERTRSRRQTSSTTPERAGTPRTSPGPRLSGAIAVANPQLRFLAAVAGIGLLSLVFMAASVAARVGSLPDWVPIHLNAEGTPDRWGEPSTMWRLPLMAFVLTAMSAIVAWFLAKRDPFASRFALTSTLIVHAMTWIALINLLW